MIGIEIMIKANYDDVASHSLDALKGRARGWRELVLISQTPLIYELFTYAQGQRLKFGEFELLKFKKECKIRFKKTIFKNKLSETEFESLSRHFEQVVNGYFFHLEQEEVIPTLPWDDEKKKEIPLSSRPKNALRCLIIANAFEDEIRKEGTFPSMERVRAIADAEFDRFGDLSVPSDEKLHQFLVWTRQQIEAKRSIPNAKTYAIEHKL